MCHTGLAYCDLQNISFYDVKIELEELTDLSHIENAPIKFVYLKLPNDIYYYFGLRKGFLEMNSNDSRFQDELTKTKKPDLVKTQTS
jgi:hypothetical protein